MTTRRTAIIACLIGLGLGNVIWQATGEQDWWAAADRTVAQAVAVLLYAFWFAPKERNE